jgi:hypothetical protein
MSQRDLSRKIFHAFVFSGLSFLLGACGGKGERFSEPTAASGTVTQDQVSGLVSGAESQFKDFGQGMVDGTALSSQTDSSSMSTLSLGSAQKELGRRKISRFRPLVDSGCEGTLAAGSKTDSDGDGIWAEGTASYSCTVGSLISMQLSGSIVMHDNDDSDIYGGFTADVQGLKFTIAGDNGSSLAMTLESTMSSTKNTDGSYTGKVVYETTVSSQGQSALAGVYLDSTITPTDSSHPVDAGTVNSLSGFVRAQTSGANVVLALTGTNLVYDQSCSGSNEHNYESGTLSLKDSSNNTIDVSYSACTPTVKYNGITISN